MSEKLLVAAAIWLIVRFKGPILLGLGDIAYLDGLWGTRDGLGGARNGLGGILSEEGLISKEETWCTEKGYMNLNVKGYSIAWHFNPNKKGENTALETEPKLQSYHK